MSNTNNKASEAALNWLGVGPFNRPDSSYNLWKYRTNYFLDNWNQFKDTYGLTDDDKSLIMPMIMNGASSDEIASYIQSLNASHQSEDKNSISSQIDDLRSVGYNPDLSGSLPGNGNVQIPSSVFSTDDLPSNGGKGSLSEKFTNVAGLVLKTMAFGLQAYGVVSNSLISTATQLSGFADADALNAIADENGVVTDVDGFIQSMIRSRGLHGRKARQYASYLSNRINSTLSITGRLRQSSDKAVALSDSKINGFKSTDEYTSKVIDFLKNTASQQALQSEYDLRIQKETNEWLVNHPEYTRERLDRELAGEIDNSNKVHAESLEASSNARRASSEADISAEKAKQEKDNTDTVKADNEVRRLKSSIQKIEIEGLDKMIEFCQEFEDKWKDQPRINWMFLPEYEKYRTYKRQLNDYYYHSKNSGNGSFKISAPGVGNVGFNF